MPDSSDWSAYGKDHAKPQRAKYNRRVERQRRRSHPTEATPTGTPTPAEAPEEQSAAERPKDATKPLWRRAVASACVLGAVIVVVQGDVVSLLHNVQSGVVHVVEDIFGSNSGSPPNTASVPVAVTDISSWGNLGGGYAFVKPVAFTQPFLKQLGNEMNGGGLDSWLQSQNAAPLNGTNVQFTLDNKGKTTIEVTNITVARTCSAPAAGSILLPPGAGQQPEPRMGFNLDSADPMAKQLNVEALTPENFFDSSTISVLPGVPQTILVKAETAKYYCTFYLHVKVVDGQNVSTVDVGSAKHPFAVTHELPVKDYTTACQLLDNSPCGVIDPKTYLQ